MAWETNETSGLIDDYVLTIQRAYFGTDAKYDNGNTLLMIWEGTTDNVDVPTITLKFSCGKKWSSVDGSSAVHDAGQDLFNKSSLYGRVIDRVATGLGLREQLEAKGDPRNASVWEGFSFRIKREKIEFGPGIDAKQREMPTEVVTAATAKAAAPTIDTATLTAALTALAKTSADHKSFVEKAMGIAGVAESEELLSSVVDPDGLFATAKA